MGRWCDECKAWQVREPVGSTCGLCGASRYDGSLYFVAGFTAGCVVIVGALGMAGWL